MDPVGTINPETTGNREITGNSGTPQKPWIPDSGIFIAVITATAYFLTLRYEAGMCNYFNIPISFVSLNPTLVMLRSAKFIYMIVVASALAIIVFNIFEYCKLNEKKYAKLIIFLLLSVFSSQLLYNINSKNDILELVTAGILVFIMICLGIIHLTKSGNTFNDRLIFYGSIMLFVAICWLGSSLFYEIGISMARDQKEYHLVKGTSGDSRVVLRIYGDHLITAPLVRSTEKDQKNSVRNELYLVKISEIDSRQLIAENVGPLTIKEKDKSQSPRDTASTVGDFSQPPIQ